jgi:hypothetical protein
MKIVAKICLIFCSLLLSTSVQVLAQSEDNPSPLTKSIDGKTYLNQFFKLTVEKPEGWYAQNSEELLALMKRGSDLVAGDDKNFRAALDASLKSSITIFFFSEVPPGTPGKPNPNLVSIAENITASPGIKNGCDYIALAKEIVNKSQIKIDFEDKCESKIVNGTEFKIVNAQINVGDRKIKQRYFALIKDSHAISVIQTFFDPESEAKVNQVLNSIKIKP